MQISISTILRLGSCTMWGISGYLSIPTEPVIGALSLLSASCFLIAIVLEMRLDKWGYFEKHEKRNRMFS